MPASTVSSRMANLNPIPFLRTAAKNSPWVVIAIAIHALLIAVLSVIYITHGFEKNNDTPTNVTLNTKLPEVVQPDPVIERKAPPKNAEEEIVDYEHDIPYQPTDLPEDLTKEVGQNTDEDSSGATGGTAIAAGAGPGHWSSGLPSTFVSKRPGMGIAGQPRGVTQSTEKAVRFGLIWLGRHQQADGSWSMSALPAICKTPAHCISDKAKFPETWQDGLTGLSLLAFLGAGYNYDSKQFFVDVVQAKKIYVGETVRRGLDWLRTKQLPDGSFGPDQQVYNQALCALALSEAYALSRNRVWQKSAQSAIDWLVRAQKISPEDSGGLWGWRYNPLPAINALKAEKETRKAELDALRAPLEAQKAELTVKRQELEGQKPTLKQADYDLALQDLQAKSRDIDAELSKLDPEYSKVTARLNELISLQYESDLSVTTWVIMAFKSASLSGLHVPDEAFQGGKKFVLATSLADGTAGYRNNRQAGMRVESANGLGNEFTYHTGTMSALSMLCRTFIDHDIDDPFLERAAQVLVKDQPEISKDKLSVDYYYWYYATLALNQFDGPDSPRKGLGKYWDQWNKAMQTSVLGTQDETEKACTHGGWVTGDRWSLEGGPIYSTAINVLTLEVYYRYANAFGATFEKIESTARRETSPEKQDK